MKQFVVIGLGRFGVSVATELYKMGHEVLAIDSNVERIDEIADSGCRGYALHSRKGNRIPYLSDRWLDLMKFACEESRKRDLKVWIYDEDGFPSGNAGRRVQKERPDLVQKCLHLAT